MQRRILVIDDSPVLLDVTRSTLQAAGYGASGAANLAELDERLASARFDLMLIDVNMPEMFGDDVVDFLRNHKGVDSRLLLYSDIPEDELRAKAETSGADGYVCKAWGPDGLVDALAAELGALPGARADGGSNAAAVPRDAAMEEASAERDTDAEPLPEATPTDAGTSPTPDASSTPLLGGSGAGKRVLVVDDSETTARLLQAELENKGFEVHVADSADKATRIILKKKTRPHLVLLDVRMPNVNGEQLCRFIKGNSLFSGIKVLLCSGESVDELKRICREAGADGFVTKDAVLARVLAAELDG